VASLPASAAMQILRGTGFGPSCDSADPGLKALVWRGLMCLPDADNVSLLVLVEEGLFSIPKCLFKFRSVIPTLEI